MSFVTKNEIQYFPIIEQIESHIAWHGNITGLETEDLLQGKNPFTFVIRKGEKLMNYYVSFVQKNGSFKHQPLLIRVTAEGWFYRNTLNSLPSYRPFVDFLHRIIHCDEGECQPLPCAHK